MGYCWNSDYINDYSWRLASFKPHDPGEPYYFNEDSFLTYELMMGFSFIGRKAPPPPPPKPEMIKITLDESVLNFAVDKWGIPKDGEPALNDAIEKLNKYNALDINIIGHTCSLGSNSWNNTLSMRRAEAVKKYFLDHGIAASRINKVDGKGESEPAFDNKTKEGRSKNRRVEISAVAPVEVPKK